MDLDELKLEYEKLKENYDEVKSTNFVDELVKVNDNETLDFHYNILTQTENEYLFHEIRGDFYRHGKKGKSFLLEKLKSERDINLKAEALFILGTLDELSPQEIDLIKETAIDFLNNEQGYKTQYYGIIVLGWVGAKEELSILASEMRENQDTQLRGYAATALRQVWYNYSRLKKSILRYYYNALTQEKDNLVNLYVIACVQDLMQKKFGVKENMRGEISGDIEMSKPKAIKALKVFLKIKK